MQHKFPEFFAERDNDKYYTRYPRGESYYDLVQRVEPCLLEMERVSGNLLVVCHQAVARCFLAYFKNIDNLAENLPYQEVPLHTLIKITPTPTGGKCLVEEIPLGIQCVSTHRPKPPVVADPTHQHLPSVDLTQISAE
jgi:6-phosphofructo-2-kinase / fructose-2,6-biphosphatase 2